MGGLFSRSKKPRALNGYLSSDDTKDDETYYSALSLPKVSPYVYQRWSSMFFDEDGDLAHEFYEEVPARQTRSRGPTLVRITTKLTPQGWIDYEFPRLHRDLPFVMVEVQSKSDVP